MTAVPGVVGDRTVRGEPERRRQPSLCPDADGERDGRDQRRQDEEDGDWQRPDPGPATVQHGRQPAARERPGRSLGHGSRLGEDRLEPLDRSRFWAVAEPVGEGGVGGAIHRARHRPASMSADRRIRREDVPHLPGRVMEPRVDGARRNPEGARGLGCRHADVVDEDEHCAMLDAELQERPFELVTRGDRRGVVGRRDRVDNHVRHLRPAPPRRAPLVGAGPDEQSMQPGVEPVRVAQAAQVTPRPDERVLDRVLSRVFVAHDPLRDRVEPVIGGRGERVERGVVATLCALDKLGRHRLHLGHPGATRRPSPSLAAHHTRILHG